MIIFGHHIITYPQFVRIGAIEDIRHSTHTQILYFDTHSLGLDKSLELAKHCQSFECAYSVEIESIKELLLFNALGAKYLITHNLESAKALQAIVEHYLLDCKLLCKIDSENMLEIVAENGIDGVIFKQILA